MKITCPSYLLGNLVGNIHEDLSKMCLLHTAQRHDLNAANHIYDFIPEPLYTLTCICQ
ncbi:hypothetical protein BKA67DRAFT_579487 [Truncatella angustata]|uniref:Uncharacterized protein n=1 Tax=Truncatella angustata TaxID=152316 RepID=A0A9P8UDU4_9PEZI|nr:uncharacterized protein BKA67DRAFT_579487 [Truncatella angustata]KAH6648095.1 hypothetical protein BKA67DRAFT_579487 [Truncatella angustata]